MAAYLGIAPALRRIEQAINEGEPLSLVRIGDGENVVLAQKSVWTQRRVMRQRWAIKARRGQKGLVLPNLAARNQMVKAIKRATIVGLLASKDRMIKAPRRLKRPLTNRLLRHFRLRPKLVCNACINRHLPKNPLFLRMLRDKRILVVNRSPGYLKKLLEQEAYGLKVTHAFTFRDYRQIRRTIRQIVAVKDEFDVALLSCGVNAVILAPMIAQRTGKVAIDFGKAYKKLRKPLS